MSRIVSAEEIEDGRRFSRNIFRLSTQFFLLRVFLFLPLLK